MNFNIELRHLRYVIAVADELHFARAAARLHLSPPSLSKQVRQLETHLGYLLFERRTRDVRLTPAGQAFIAESREVLRQMDRAFRVGAEASGTACKTIKVGYSPWIDPSILMSVLNVVRQGLPELEVTFVSAYSRTQIEQLNSGQLQVGIVVLPVVAAGPTAEVIWRDSLEVAIPAGHRLGSVSEISGKDLSGERIIWMSRSVNPELYDHLIEACQTIGLSLNIIQEVSTVQEALNLVAANVGVTLVKANTSQQLHPDGVMFRPLAEPGLSVEIGLAFRETASKEIQAFLHALRSQLRQRI